MKPLTVISQYIAGPFFEKNLRDLAGSRLVEEIIIVCPEPVPLEILRCRFQVAGPIQSQETLEPLLTDLRTPYLLLFPGLTRVSLEDGFLGGILAVAEFAGAGIVYSDFHDEDKNGKTLHPLNDYQLGSVRDDFDFGAAMLYSVPAIRKALDDYGPIPDVQHAGLYDIRLKVSIDHDVYHLREPLYSVVEASQESAVGERMFAYVDPRNVAVQREMEAVFTGHLRNINAYLPPGYVREVVGSPEPFPVVASVIIPVRNRERTITEAVESALSQETDFPFNVIVVDNHSTDGTTTALTDLAGRYPCLNHIIPTRPDLGIGGCWNEALYSPLCGCYAVQLDSDDLYSGPETLQKIVNLFRQDAYAMVIGSYTIVNFDLEEIPPGLIDHREWTYENGRNNALRINGFGAPRAFDTRVMRSMGFLNVSYGEDYAAVLRICREYRIGRIFESLYLCRRWPGNTDASLSLDAMNKNNAFKDKVRTDEILARQGMMRHRLE